MDRQVHSRLHANLQRVQERIAAAAQRAGRSGEDVRLIAVTKYVAPQLAAALIELGCDMLGESRPQELWNKAAALADRTVHWHLVGHLQRNKVRRTVPLVTMIHSLDRLSLARELDKAAREANRPLEVLVEVNISGESAKHGCAPDELEGLLAEFAPLDHLRIRGLMTMAHRTGGADVARRDFAALRGLAEKMQSRCPPNALLVELSMGMSNDFEAAIEQGATMVRIGSILFEGVSEG